MAEDPIIDIKFLEHIADTQLFYPASANDYLVPIAIFAPYIKDFWFVDTGYFSPTGYFGQVSFLTEPPVLRLAGYELIKHHRKDNLLPNEDWKNDRKYSDGPPCVRTEEYCHLASKQKIQLHFYRRRGCTVLRKDINTLVSAKK